RTAAWPSTPAPGPNWTRRRRAAGPAPRPSSKHTLVREGASSHGNRYHPREPARDDAGGGGERSTLRPSSDQAGGDQNADSRLDRRAIRDGRGAGKGHRSAARADQGNIEAVYRVLAPGP